MGTTHTNAHNGESHGIKSHITLHGGPVNPSLSTPCLLISHSKLSQEQQHQQRTSERTENAKPTLLDVLIH